MYLGQRGPTRLAVKTGIELPENYQYPHADMCTIRHETHAQCLKLVQAGIKDEAHKASVVQFYQIDHVMILGRVSKGEGGDIMLATAKKVLETEFPEYAGIEFHTADDHFKGVGQCIAAAALPEFSG